MVENSRQLQSKDPFDRFHEAVNDPRLYESYHYPRADLPEPAPLPHDRVPLFLSDYEEERYQDEHYQQVPEYSFAAGRKKKRWVSRIVTGVLALSAIAAGFALFSIDSTRAVIFNAKASLANAAPTQVSASQPEAAAPQQVAAQPANTEPTAASDAAATRRIPPPALASASPSRDEITAAYQSALKSKVVAAVEPAAPVARELPSVRRIDSDELAALLKRAKGLLAIGDITAARLLLERAADAQEPEAALMLAGTYDPQVLGSQDMRSVTPDPAAARLWYQKAAQLGSADAKRRLSQSQN
jgi:flagellar basal body-associated protein FliL